MKETVEHIRKLTGENLPDDSYFIVDIAVTGKRSNIKIRILVDSDRGISVEECSGISKQLSQKLDQMELLQYGYLLEVSSPGLDFPLSGQRQYRKNIGREVKVMLKDHSAFKGKLVEVRHEGIRILDEPEDKKKFGDERFIHFDDIMKTNVMVTFK